MTLLVGALGTAVAASSTQSAPTGYPYPSPPTPPPPAPPPSPATYTLSVTRDGTGAGTVTSTPAGIGCGADCSEAYPGGTSVTLAAVPDGGSTFAGWSGACAGTGTCTVVMDASKTVTATFAGQKQPVADTVVAAQLDSARVVRRAGGRRALVVELQAGEVLDAVIELRRRGVRLAGKETGLEQGERVVTLRIPGRIGGGRALARVLLQDAAGNERVFARRVRIPGG